MHPGATAVVVGNEPRCYREAIGALLQAQRPDLRVLIVEPDEVDRSVDRDHPVLVICSRLTEAVEERAPAWIVLYPQEKRRVILGLWGHRVEQPDLELDELIAFLDRAERLSEAGRRGTPRREEARHAQAARRWQPDDEEKGQSGKGRPVGAPVLRDAGRPVLPPTHLCNGKAIAAMVRTVSSHRPLMKGRQYGTESTGARIRLTVNAIAAGPK